MPRKPQGSKPAPKKVVEEEPVEEFEEDAEEDDEDDEDELLEENEGPSEEERLLLVEISKAEDDKDNQKLADLLTQLASTLSLEQVSVRSVDRMVLMYTRKCPEP